MSVLGKKQWWCEYDDAFELWMRERRERAIDDKYNSNYHFLMEEWIKEGFYCGYRLGYDAGLKQKQEGGVIEG